MRYLDRMRTTLAIDDDLLLRAKAIAELEDRPLGVVVSRYLREAMERSQPSLETRNGFPLLPRRGAVVTLEMVNAARDDEE